MGVISFWHPKKFAVQENVLNYENSFIEFLDLNGKLLLDNGAEDFELFIEAYYEGEQCNFEIFDKKILKRLALYNVSLPISVYCLKEDEYSKWSREILETW